MKRALLIACLATSPAAAEVEVVFTPQARGPVFNRPYFNPAGSYALNRYWATRGGYFANSETGSPVPTASAHTGHARFQYYPNYRSRRPSLPGYYGSAYGTANGTYGSGYEAYVQKKPLPVIEPLPREEMCDTYTDEVGCLDGRYSGW